jgi:hypothetical protein
MMKYIYLRKNIVQEIIPEYDAIFPNVPIISRYSPEFLSKCVVAEDSVETPIGYLYDPETGTFAAPVVEEIPEETGA